ncbi:AAA family ATPase [Bremerella cremea]|uniref:AAA family ATPase n=1 Tax=Bremerella cremea TaxID=1031537 RepID=UPI0013140DA9|nr:AAA family ATPase [Bremerella cremea]
MKLRRLDLNNFGIHADQSFPFAEKGLQLVYGRNEAGKSTLLQAVRELLFGFTHAGSNPFAPEAKSKKMLATALLGLKDGTELEIVRRQGNKNTLSGRFPASDETIDEGRWWELLSGADQQMYQHVFGFSLQELATGEDSLKEANLDEALFGGGLGRLHDYKQLIKNIDEEAENLFKSRGQKQQINSILTEIKGLKQELKDSSLRPAEYEEWLTQAERCEDELTRLQTMRDEAFRRQQHLDRLKRAYPLWIELQTKQQQLEKLDAPSSFPADALQELTQTRSQAKKLTSEIDDLSRDLARMEKEVGEIQFNQALIESSEAIRSLVYGIKEIRGYRRDIPIRQQEREQDLNEATRILRRIDPKLQLDQIDQFELTFADRNSIQQLARKRQKVQTELESQTPELERVEREVREMKAALTEVPVKSLELVERLRSSRQSLADAIKRKAELDAAISDLKLKLSQRSASVEVLLEGKLDTETTLPIPLEPTITKYDQELQALAEEVRSAARTVREANEELVAKRDELRRLEQGADLVTLEALEKSRSERDASWESLRRILLEESEKPSPEELQPQADSFAGQVHLSDDMADQRYRNAQLLAEHQAIVGQIAMLEERFTARQCYAKELDEKRQTLLEAWESEWKPCGIRPKSPREMHAWRLAYLELVQINAEIKRKRIDLSPLDQRIEATTTLLRETDELSEHISTTEMLSWIDSFLREAESQREKQTEFKIRIQSLEEQQRSSHQSQEKRKQQLAEIETRAREILVVFQTLGEVNVEMASDLIQAIDEVQGRLVSAAKLEQRIHDKQQGLDEFQQQVQTVLTATGEALEDMPPEHAAERLGALLTEAETRHARRKELEFERQVTSQTRDSRQAEHAELEARLAKWRKQVAVDSDDELENVSQLVRARQKIESEIATKENELALVRQSEESVPFLEALSQLDRDQLELDLTEITQQFASIQDNLAEANQQLGELNSRLREVDLSSRAVIAQGKIESLQADLSDCLDRLGPLLIAKEMLGRAMKAFREENSGQLLASISDLLQQMTEGRYVKVEHDLEQEGGLLLLGPGEIRKKPSQLSTGTREQLYLAIRLAYIRHYCQGAEPLPVLMDDILVNFDDERQVATLKVLADFDPEIQIILLTCHQPLVAKVQSLKGENQIHFLDGEAAIAEPPKAKPSRKKSSPKSSTPSLFENA